MNQATEPIQGGGGISEPKGTEPTGAATAAPTQTEGNFDDFGYPIEKTPEATQVQSPDPNAQSKQAPTPEPTKEGKASVAGYGEDDPKPAEETKPAPIPSEPKSTKEELGYELDLKEVDAPVAAKIAELAKTHKLSEDQAKALVEFKKAEVADFKAAQEAQKKEMDKKIAEVKAAWHKELKDDKDFGGQNFGHSLKKVDKVMSDFLGETKNKLTADGSMLPPYVMRDLLKLANHLYKTESLVQGDTTGQGEEKHFLDELYS